MVPTDSRPTGATVIGFVSEGGCPVCVLLSVSEAEGGYPVPPPIHLVWCGCAVLYSSMIYETPDGTSYMTLLPHAYPGNRARETRK